MKKTLLSAVAIFALIGCSKEQIQNVNIGESEKIATLTCCLPQTKMSVNDKGKTVWQAGDQITVFNDVNATTGGGDKKTYTLVSGAGTNKGTFAGEAFAKGNARVALYPAAYGEDGSFQKATANRLIVHINGSYTMTSASEDQNVPAIMAAYIANNATSITFEHVASLLKLQFTGIPSSARKIKIYQDGISGETNLKKYGIIGDRYFGVTGLVAAGGTGVVNTGGVSAKEAWLNMSVTFPDNQAIESGNGVFYFPIAVQQNLASRTFRVNFLDASDQVIANTERTLTSGKFTAGKMIVFPAVPAVTKTVAVESVSVAPAELTIAPGETATITPTVLPADATDKSVSWSSTDETVATVSDAGVVTAVAVGTTTITATTTDGGKTATCAVTVEAESKIIADWALKDDIDKTKSSFLEATGTYQTTFPGDNAKNLSATTGTGSITYYAKDSRTADADHFCRLVGSKGDPYVQGCLPGDYWLIKGSRTKTIPAGTKLSIYFVTKCGNATSSYWMLEYKDGDTWKPVKATSEINESATEDINGGAVSYSKKVTYNLCFEGKDSKGNGAYIAVSESFTTSVDMNEIQLRFYAAGELGYNGNASYGGKWLSNIYNKSSQQRFSAQEPTGSATTEYKQHVTLKIAD